MPLGRPDREESQKYDDATKSSVEETFPSTMEASIVEYEDLSSLSSTSDSSEFIPFGPGQFRIDHSLNNSN